MKKIFGNSNVNKTPLGFCDVQQRALVGYFSDPQKRRPRYHHTYKPVGKAHRAAASNEKDAAQLQVMITLDKDLKNVMDYKGRTPLHFACAYGRDAAVTVLVKSHCEINARDNNSVTPLMKAVQCCRGKCASILLNHQADANIKDSSGNTALHYAIYNGDSQMTEVLLQSNADIEQKTQDGFTPLLLALRENSTKTATVLINKGANVKAADEYERNTLMYAVRCNSPELFELLLEKGIDLFSKDVFDWTVLRYAVEGQCTFKSIILDHQERYIKKKAARRPKEKCPKAKSVARLLKNPNSGTVGHATNKNGQSFQAKNVPEHVDIKSAGDSARVPDRRDRGRKSDRKETSDDRVPLLKSIAEEKESILKEPIGEESPPIMSGGGN